MKTAVERLKDYHAALEARDFDSIENMLAPNVHYISAGIGNIKGRDELLNALRSYFETHPDHQAADDHVEQGGANAAVSHWRLRATNRRTGVAIERRGIEVVTFDDDGLIARIEVLDRQ